MAVTVKEIAEMAGVSRGTVDRVINNRGGVKKEVEDRIRKIVEQLDYKPNLVAKGLAKKNMDKKIGVILNAHDNPFYKDVILGVEAKDKEIVDFGFKTLLRTTHCYDIEEQLKRIDELVAEDISGLILSPINSECIANRLNELNIPIVTVNTDIPDVAKLCYVGSDYLQAGYVAANIFGITGHRHKIGIVTGNKLILGHNMRIQGFKEAIEQEQYPIEILGVYENDDTDIKSYLATKQMLEEHPELTGIFFAAGGIEGGLKAVEDLGLLKKVMLITVDTIESVKKNLLEGNIAATICQEPYEQGYEAIKIMFDFLMTGQSPDTIEYLTKTQIKFKYNI